MAEPIRKPVHRPRPPHPHTQQRPHAVLVRPESVRPDPVRPAPALAPPPPPPAVLPPSANPVPLDEPLPAPALPAPTADQERSARGLLSTALALHLGVLLAAWFGQPVPDLGPTDLLLAGTVLFSGGGMLLLGGLRRRR